MPTAATLGAPADAPALPLAAWPTVVAMTEVEARRRGLDADEVAQAAAVQALASAARFDPSLAGTGAWGPSPYAVRRLTSCAGPGGYPPST